jgi:SOS-response transcriptional repressor LexA
VFSRVRAFPPFPFLTLQDSSQRLIDLLAGSLSAPRAILMLDGFDETPPENSRALRQLYGALKQRWPALRTVAALDWSEYEAHVRLSLPLDVWVQEPKAMRTVSEHCHDSRHALTYHRLILY